MESDANSTRVSLMQKCQQNSSANHTDDDDYRLEMPNVKYSGDPQRSATKAKSRSVLKYVLCAILVIGLLIGIGLGLYFYFTATATRYVSKSTKTVTFRGRIVKSGDGTEIEEYLGIPFAKPPVGELRYSDPVPLGNSTEGTYDALDFKNSCVQPLDTTFGTFQGSDMWNAKNTLSEDCLYLNIWRPAKSSSNPRAVLVWIYGGGFFSGSNSLWVYNGKALAAVGDVVVVSFNYRVGTFGFLSSGDGRIKGNFGMKDQVLALEWIQQNIAQFGGDPTLVTLFGESSGASSAGLHQMSSYSQNLFARAIYESGSADSHWSFMSKTLAAERSQLFFDGVNCRQSDRESLLQCLRKLDVDEILEKEWVTGYKFMAFPWVPTVDDDFLLDTPYKLLNEGRFQKKPAIVGVNRDEGTYWILYGVPGFTKDGPSLQNYSMYLDAIDTIAWDLSESNRNQLKATYLYGDGSNQVANREAIDKVCGDRAFTCPVMELAEHYNRQDVTTYFYYLVYRASNEVWPPWMGVIHGAEIQWIFGMPYDSSRRYTAEEVEFSRVIMQYWAYFARTGDPNGAGLPDWPAHTQTQKNYLEMKSPGKFVGITTFREKYCDLWKRINDEINA